MTEGQGNTNVGTKEKVFENILNFRDVGKTINELVGEKYVFLVQTSLLFCIYPSACTVGFRQQFLIDVFEIFFMFYTHQTNNPSGSLQKASSTAQQDQVGTFHPL